MVVLTFVWGAGPRFGWITAFCKVSVLAILGSIHFLFLPKQSMHLGETPSGQNFEDCYVDFDKLVMAPYRQFLARLHGESNVVSLSLDGN